MLFRNATRLPPAAVTGRTGVGEGGCCCYCNISFLYLFNPHPYTTQNNWISQILKAFTRILHVYVAFVVSVVEWFVSSVAVREVLVQIPTVTYCDTGIAS